MRIQDLYYFKMLCETKSFTLTAQLNYVSQPKISIAIKRLEEELNINLVIRKKFSDDLKVTSNGMKLLEFINYFDKELNILKKEIAEKEKNINIGIPSVEGKALVGNYLNELYSRKNININLIEMKREELKEQNIFDKLDYYFTCYINNDNKSNNNKIFIKKIGVELAFKDIYLENIKSLNNKVIISLKRYTYHFKILNIILKKFDIKPKRIIFLESFESAQMLIEENVGVAIIMEGTFKSNEKINKKKIEAVDIEVYLEYSEDKIKIRNNM